MRIERVFLEKITTVQLDIGYVGEHDHCRVIIDSASLLAYYPNALASMVAKSPAGVLYPVVLQQDGNDVIWNVSDSDLARAGIGTFQLTFTQNGEVIKTAHGSYKVDPSLLAEGDPPDPIESWIEEANQKLAEVTEAVQDATEAAENADSMASEAEEAASDANTAAALANEKATLADQKATLADTAASSANTAAASATSAASSATSAASNATSAASSANTAASTANTAAGKIDNMTVAASSSQTPTATITEVDGHKHILFGLVKGDPGKDFHIAKTFSSIAQMMAYTGTDVDPYDFAMIDTGSVQDPDTGKLYCYEPDKTPKWQYIGDLSGAQGIKGETGTGISSIALNQDYTLTIYLDDGTSYTTTSIRGAKGDTGDPGTPGAPGDPGPAGQNAYVYIRYSTSEPVQDSDMHTTPDNWMGIYSGTASTAPTAYTDYAWYKIKGETGSATNVYGTTVPMSEQDSTKVATAIGNKLDANQGSANAGKFMKVGNDGGLVPDTVPDPTGKADKVTNATSGNFAGLDSNGNLTDSGSKASDFLTQHQDISGKADKVSSATSGNFAGLDANGNLTDSGHKHSDYLTQHQDISGKADKVSNATSGNFAGLDANGNLTDSGHKHSDYLTQHQDISGKVDKNQGVAYAGKALGINEQGMVEPVAFSGGTDFTGATGTTAGTHGLVPAPAAGDNVKYLMGNGTWEVAPGARIVQVTTTVTNTSGAYTATIQDARISADMKAIGLEIANPYVFNDKITVTCNLGSVTFSCNDVTGTSVVKINIIKADTNTATMTSEEFDILEAAKVDIDQGVENAGKALGINAQGMVEPVPFSGEDFTGATSSTAGTHGYVPAPAAGDQNKFLKANGTWASTPVSPQMAGATATTPGLSGLVPAPAAGAQDKVLTGAGTWVTPVGSRVLVVDLDDVTNTSGSYTHTTTVTGMTGDLKAVAIECSDPTIFKDTVTVTTGTDSVTLTCNEVAGSSTVKVSFLAIGNANPLSSTEYGALNERIGDLSDLTTTDKSSVVSAVNEVNNNVIEHGRIALSSLTNTTTVGSTTYYYNDFTFSKTFPSAPHVIMSTVNYAWPGAGDIGGNYFATNITATGFRLISKYNIASYYMDWIAIADNT